MAENGLSGKVAVVAGGATGIGAATAKRLAEEGCRVVVGDPADGGGRRTARDITSAGGIATPVVFDLAEQDSVRALFDTATTTYGGVDLLFNVGADMSTLRGDTDVVDIDLAVWDRTMTVNLRGYVLTMKHAIPHMLARVAALSSTCLRPQPFRASLPDLPTRQLKPESVRSQGMSRHDGAKKVFAVMLLRRGSLRPKRSGLCRSGRTCRPPHSSGYAAPESGKRRISLHS